MLDYQSTGDASKAADTLQVVASVFRRLPRRTSSHQVIQPGRNALALPASLTRQHFLSTAQPIFPHLIRR